MDHDDKTFVLDRPYRHPLQETFIFSCNRNVSCFKACCRNLELPLYPYDIIRLKRAVGIHSAEFLYKHVRLLQGPDSTFPFVTLKMCEDAQAECPFLGPSGCTVYQDRPSACRTYPLERAVGQTAAGAPLLESYCLVRHPYCLGHDLGEAHSLDAWSRSQGLAPYNLYNDLWASLAAFFATNPWGGEGRAGPLQRLAFMVCYSIDDFRDYVANQRVLESQRFSREERRRLQRDDAALLKFGFAWLRATLAAQADRHGPLR